MSKLQRVLIFTALLAFSGALWAADGDIQKAQELMKQGKPAEAYSLLEAMEYEKAGEVDFDYLLGIAALDSGKPDKATLAFERVLAVNPNFAGARLDMARAYFMLGDLERANTEFGAVLALNPPPAARQVVQKYLTAIEDRKKATLTRISGYVEGVAGYDDNISAVTNDFTFGAQQAGFGPGLNPTGNSVKRDGGFFGLGGGMEVLHTLNDQSSLYGAAGYKRRDYDSQGGDYNGQGGNSRFNSESVDLSGGVQFAVKTNLYRMGAVHQQYRQDGAFAGTSNNRDTTGINFEWRRMLDERNQVGAFAQYNQQRYENQITSDIDQSLLGATWLRAFGGKGNPILFSSLMVGRDDALNQISPGKDFSKDYWGVRLYGQYTLNPSLDAFAGFGYQWRNDTSMYARAATVAYGKDELSDISLGLNWRPYKEWTVRPQIVYSQNSSNIALYEYDRTETSITVRRDFR
ncbi:MAG: surface lipoprotein assembly modifier [Sulfuricella sp.]